ncbi:MAG TPA: cytochrome c [Pseudolabrys sp.]|nr:cytochrome c [Pseudolabrys sp.]
MRKWRTIAATGVLVGAGLAAYPVVRTMASDSDAQDFAQIERGRRLATLADCAACHTNKDSGKPFAGGRPIETPFGNVLAPNITPDRETGIGNWSDEDFDNAVRHGIDDEGKRLYPAMPYVYYTKMSRDDVKAIRAYLATVPAVHNKVHANQLPFPFSIRWTMYAWDWLYFTPGEFKPDKTKSPEWNRGAFLVTGPGHCGACHTPKSFLGGDETDQALQGYAIQGWFAPSITGDKVRGVGSMSIPDIVALLKTGHNAVTGVAGPMAEQVADSSSHFSDADLKAIATYLQSLPGGNDKPPSPVAQDDPRMKAGQAIYRDTCSACHGIDGNGVPSLFPSLVKAPQVHAPDPTSNIRVVLRGVRSAATEREPTAPAMPSFDWQLKDDQIAAVLTYIRNSWGGAAPAVSADDVHKARDELADRSD